MCYLELQYQLPLFNFSITMYAISYANELHYFSNYDLDSNEVK